MSATQAVRAPRTAPRIDEAPRRHLDIAPSRAQRRARPRIYAALTAIGGIIVILLGQLLMSIALADGAYQIASLQREQRDLVREQHAAEESLEQLSSTQNVVQNAAALGMVPSGDPVFLDVATGAALGSARGSTGQVVGAGGNLIGNVLLADGSTMLDPAAIDAAKAGGVKPEAQGPLTPTTENGESGVTPVTTTPGTLPSPTTR